MLMLTAEIASTTVKPSMTLPRNRKLGSLRRIDCGQTRLDNPTSNPHVFPETGETGTRGSRSGRKTRAEWIKGRKLARKPHPESRPQKNGQPNVPGDGKPFFRPSPSLLPS